MLLPIFWHVRRDILLIELYIVKSIEFKMLNPTYFYEIYSVNVKQFVVIRGAIFVKSVLSEDYGITVREQYPIYTAETTYM